MFSFFKKKEPDSPHLDEEYIRSRSLVIDLDPHKFKPTEQGKTIATWGIMVDIGLPEMFFTVVATIDGTTNVYTSSGASRSGFGNHPNIAKMSQDLLTMANNYTGQFRLTQNYPLPSKNLIRLYIFKYDGIYMGECKSTVLTSDATIHELFRAQNWAGVMAKIAWSIVDEIRIAKDDLLAETQTNMDEKSRDLRVKALYIMAFTPKILDPEMLRGVSFFAGDRLKTQVPVFKQLMEKGLALKAPIEIANHQYTAGKDTPQAMKNSMKSWLEGEFKLTFDPVIGKNFFMQGVRDRQNQENTILFYFDIEE